MERKAGTYAASVDRAIFAAKEAEARAAKAAVKTVEPEVQQKGKESYALGKERSRLEKRLSKVEEQIASMEEAIEAKKEELLKPEYASSYSKLGEITARIEEMEAELLELMDEWEIVGQQLETLG